MAFRDKLNDLVEDVKLSAFIPGAGALNNLKNNLSSSSNSSLPVSAKSSSGSIGDTINKVGEGLGAIGKGIGDLPKSIATISQQPAQIVGEVGGVVRESGKAFVSGTFAVGAVVAVIGGVLILRSVIK